MPAFLSFPLEYRIPFASVRAGQPAALASGGVASGPGACSLAFNSTTGNVYAAYKINAGQIVFHRFNPNTVGSTLSTSATFHNSQLTSSAFSTSLYFDSITGNAYLFSFYISSNTIVTLHRFNPETVSGTNIAPVATFAVRTTADASINSRLIFKYNSVTPSNSFLFCTNSAEARIYFFRLNPATIASTSTAANATFAPGITSIWLDFHYNGANSYLFSAANGSARVDFWRFNADTISTTNTASTTTIGTGSGPNALQFVHNSTDSYLFVSSGNTGGLNDGILLFRFNPLTLSSSPSIAARFQARSVTTKINVHFNESNSHLLICEFSQNNISYYRLNPGSLTGGTVVTLSDRALTFQASGPRDIDFLYNGANSYLLVANEALAQVYFYRLNLLQYYYDVSAFFNPPALPYPGISKTTTTPLTISAEISSFEFLAAMRFGSTLTATDHPTERFQYAFTVGSDDAKGTLAESLIFSGATAGVVGEYRLTMASGTTTTLSSKSTYSDSFTLLSGATLALTASATLTNDFILNSGVTVARAEGSAGDYTLTLPYANPGLTVGANITLASPQPTIAVTGCPVGANVAVYTGSTLILSGVAGVSGIVSGTYDPQGSIQVIIRARLAGRVPFEVTTTFTSAGLTVPVFMPVDTVFTP